MTREEFIEQRGIRRIHSEKELANYVVLPCDCHETCPGWAMVSRQQTDRHFRIRTTVPEADRPRLIEEGALT